MLFDLVRQLGREGRGAPLPRPVRRQRQLPRLGDFFIDEKILYWKRDAIPLLCSGKEILWIPGYRRSDKALVDEETKEIVCVEERR